MEQFNMAEDSHSEGENVCVIDCCGDEEEMESNG